MKKSKSILLIIDDIYENLEDCNQPKKINC